MHPHLTLLTLGVRDLDRAVTFYRDGLGWPMSTQGDGQDVAFFQLGPVILSLYRLEHLARDARLPVPEGGFGGISLAHNVGSRAEVDAAVAAWVAAGGTVTAPAQETFWGGYNAHLADPDGHVWEIAHNPFWELSGEGNVRLGA